MKKTKQNSGQEGVVNDIIPSEELKLEDYKSVVQELVSLSEKQLQGRIIEPLLQQLGFSNVHDTSGPTEQGKDLIATKQTEFGKTELYAIQIKKQKATGKATKKSSFGALLVQLRQALQEPVLDPTTGVRRSPDRLIFVTPYALPHPAREQFYEQSREPALRPLEIVDGAQLVSLLRRYLPSTIVHLSMESQYRLRVLNAVNQIPESTVAFQRRNGLRLEDIWVDVSVGPGDRSLYVIAHLPLDKHSLPDQSVIKADVPESALPETIDTFKQWAGTPSAGKYKLRRLSSKKRIKSGQVKSKVDDEILEQWFRVDVDKLLERPRLAVHEMLNDVASLADDRLDDDKVAAIATKTIEVLNGIRDLTKTPLIREVWNQLESRLTNTSQIRNKTNIPSTTLLRLQKCVFVVGGPGSGKTTLFRRLSMVQARERDSRLPLYFPLVNFAGDTLNHLLQACAASFESLASGRLARNTEIITFERSLKRGELVLFLDGLDETGSSRDQVLSSIEELVKTYPRTQVFLSCRDALGFPHWNRAFTVTLEPFTDKQIADFVGRWFTSQPTQRHWLLQWLQENSSMRDVARTPLFAALLCSLVEFGEDMPTTEFELYERRFDLLLGRWERAKGITPLSRAVRDIYMFFLMALGFHLHSNERRTITNKEILELATRYQFPKFSSKPGKVVEDCIHRGLLMREPGGGLSLGHLTYQEYLAGLWLAEHNPNSFIWSRILSPWWEKTLEFYAAKKKEIDILLKISMNYGRENKVVNKLKHLSEIAWMTSKTLLNELNVESKWRQNRSLYHWEDLPKPPSVLLEQSTTRK